MRDDMVILNRQLHTFKVDELKELRRISDTIFEPLMRPFRQKRVVQEFSFNKSIKLAQRIGAFMPAYERTERSHRKSRLVIAMSLAGIDRCSAVSLIPLFSTLKETALDFNFYVYTDDLIKAEFTNDGFLANDYQIAWNHVSGPNVMQRLADLDTHSQEDILLIIDSIGGGQSKWYEYWSYDERTAVREEQDRYLSVAGKYGCYSRIRKQLSGDYNKIKAIKNLPDEWLNKVRSNTQQRWMETPALEEYMVRWVFHPKFGETKHGEYYVPYQSAFDVMRKLRGKFRQIHLLTPNNQGSHKYALDRMLKENVVDYHHKANTIYGFATVLSNIVHGQCPFDGPYTKKVSYEIVKFSDFTGEEAEEIGESGDDGDHSNLKVVGQCFDKLPLVTPEVPPITTVKLEKKTRGSSQLQNYELSYSELDVSEFIPVEMTLQSFWKDKILPYDFEIERGDSEYTKLRKAEEVLEVIQTHHIVYKKGFGFMGLVREKRPAVSEASDLQNLLANINYLDHHTNSLQDHVESFFLTIAPIYHKYFSAMPLKHVLWCGGSQYAQDKRAISINPTIPVPGRKAIVWHELGHYLEGVCLPVSTFSNELLKQKGGELNKKKLVQVGTGKEWAMPVVNGTPEWIKDYAGKWYKRIHPNVPNATEIVSVHSEFFTGDKEKLVQLIKHDANMVRFMAFVYMGGPVAAIESLQELKRRQALEQINQGSRKSSGRGGWGRGGGKGSRGGSMGKTNHGFGF